MHTSPRWAAWLAGCRSACPAIICGGLAAEPTARPNILWITAEDISSNLGCYGDPYARTPRLDALARQSIRYTHPFASASGSSLCSIL